MLNHDLLHKSLGEVRRRLIKAQLLTRDLLTSTKEKTRSPLENLSGEMLRHQWPKQRSVSPFSMRYKYLQSLLWELVWWKAGICISTSSGIFGLLPTTILTGKCIIIGRDKRQKWVTRCTRFPIQSYGCSTALSTSPHHPHSSPIPTSQASNNP